MKDDNVIIISDDREKSEKIVSKILLLRSLDSVGIMNYATARELLKTKTPELLLIHVSNFDDVDIVSQIRLIDTLKNTSIIMISEFEDSELLCKAFDAGIDDFMNINVEETELIMRIMWGLKKKLILDSSNKKSTILSLIDVIDKQTGFYKKTYSQKIFSEEFNQIKNKSENTVLMMLTVDIKYKSKITVQGLGDIIKKLLRANDIVGYAPDGKFYLMLYQTTETGAKRVFERINCALQTQGTISAAAMMISNGYFTDAERFLNKQLGNALTETNTLIFANDELDKTKPGVFDKSALKENNLKIIKRVFLNKIEKLITPTFFKMQAIYEPKIFNTRITQNVNENESNFLIKGNLSSAQIVIKYCDYTKLTVEIINTNKNTTNIEKMTFEPGELTTERLENIIQTVADNYRNNINNSEDEKL